MTFDEWIALIRDVAHTGDEVATLHLAMLLRWAPKERELHTRWRDVSAYAACLDLDEIARVMAANGWRLNRADGSAPSRTVTSPCGHKFRLSPARYIAAWADEVPRVTPDPRDTRDHIYSAVRWWECADKGEVYRYEGDVRSALWSFTYLETSSKIKAGEAVEAALARIQHRALVQYLRARLWMEP